MSKIDNIDDYIRLQSPQSQKILQKMRRTIHRAAPEAIEKITYGMPVFFLREPLVYFSALKHHIVFYPTSSGVKRFTKELLPYSKSMGAVHFSPEQCIPYALIDTITRFRVTEIVNKEIAPHPILMRLSGGTRCSLGITNTIVQYIHKDKNLFAALIYGMTVHDPIIRMRSADAAEKISRKSHHMLNAHKQFIISHLPEFVQKEVRWHIAPMCSRLLLSKKEASFVFKKLRSWTTEDVSRIVIANTLEALAHISNSHVHLHSQFSNILKRHESSSSPAITARCKKIRKLIKNQPTLPMT